MLIVISFIVVGALIGWYIKELRQDIEKSKVEISNLKLFVNYNPRQVAAKHAAFRGDYKLAENYLSENDQGSK